MQAMSETIRIARVLCIFAVMFVHVYAGFSGFPVLRAFGPEDVLYHFMSDLLGRSSVPLLTVISGWLSIELARPWRRTIRGKITSLVVPLILWNLVMLAMMAVYSLLKHDRSELPGAPMEWANAMLALTAQPVNTPLGFLRDLFVVMLLSPLLVLAVRRLGGWVLIPLFALAVLVPHSVVLLRTQIAFFFTLGLWLHGAQFRALPSWLVAVFMAWSAGSFGAKMMALAADGAMATGPLQENIDRLAIAGLFWQAAAWLRGRPAGEWIARLEPYAFLAFCSHFVLFRALSVVGVPTFGDLRSPLYPIYFLLQPVAGFAAAVVLAQILRPLPGALRVLNAGKLPQGPGAGARRDGGPVKAPASG